MSRAVEWSQCVVSFAAHRLGTKRLSPEARMSAVSGECVGITLGCSVRSSFRYRGKLRPTVGSSSVRRSR